MQKTTQAPQVSPAIPDPNAENAAWGAALVAEYQRRIGEKGATKTRRGRAARGVVLARQHYRMRCQGRMPVDSADSQSMFTEAVCDVLHYADGWYTASAVLDAAFVIHQAATPPALPEPAADPRTLEILASLVADLCMTAAAMFNVAVEDVADVAETDFLDDVDEARFNAVRAVRN
ncbi:hypothetical protein [Streptomyces sp. NBC_00134]|uniref:hypothetical protein n=1 Tax=Streptomyces sp. NBC_00134 TaxID=2975663 RepID=UPI002F915190